MTVTDIDDAGILEQIRRNIAINNHLLPPTHTIHVAPLDFTNDTSLLDKEDSFDMVLAGDVIYDDNITAAFVSFIGKLAAKAAAEGTSLSMVIATEKRYVFTLAELDTVAPAFDCFLELLAELMQKQDRIRLEFLDTDFAQYFCYERSKELVLIKVSL